MPQFPLRGDCSQGGAEPIFSSRQHLVTSLSSAVASTGKTFCISDLPPPGLQVQVLLSAAPQHDACNAWLPFPFSISQHWKHFPKQLIKSSFFGPSSTPSPGFIRNPFNPPAPGVLASRAAALQRRKAPTAPSYWSLRQHSNSLFLSAIKPWSYRSLDP